MADFKVKRHHQGERDYVPGDIRTANPSEVAHLVPLTLEPIEVKQVRQVQNKMEHAPKNKSKSENKPQSKD